MRKTDQNRRQDGKYDFDLSDLDRECKCGHTLGQHSEQGCVAAGRCDCRRFAGKPGHPPAGTSAGTIALWCD